jgi:6,7-dimethyl-8-ribityllumazine synthase
MAHETGLYHGYVALGCVLRGETSHYDIVANESARGLMDLTLEGLCIGNGILTCETEAQAWERANTNAMDKGGGAAETALAMIRFSRLMSRKAAGLDVKATP